MPRKKKNTYVIVSIIACLAILLTGTSVAYTLVQDYYRQVVTNMGVQINKASTDISNYVKEKLHAASELAAYLSGHLSTDSAPEAFQQSVRALQPFYLTGVFDDLGAADLNGTLFRINGHTEKIADNDGYRQACRGLRTIIIDQYAEREAALFFAPIYSGTEIIGVISASLNIEKLTAILSSAIYLESETCYIVDNDGNVMAKAGSPRILESNIFDMVRSQLMKQSDVNRLLEQMRDDFRSDEYHMTHMNMRDDDQLIGYRSIQDVGKWNVMGIVQERALWQLCRPLIVRTVLLTVVSVLAALALVIALAKSKRKAQERLEMAAFYDVVTCGNNMNYFKSKAVALLRKHKELPYMLIRFDIDQFRNWNKCFGNEIGDQILKLIYQQALSRWPEEKGELIARMHSDEFVVLAAYYRGTNVHREILSLVQEALQLQGLSMTPSVAVGAYLVTDADEPLDQMIDKAQLAKQYFKKNETEHSCYFTDRLMETAAEVSEMEKDMARALKDNEFVVYYQPKQRLNDGRCAGVEALVRWNSSKFGFVMPSRFIQVFENNGFIQEVDFYVLESACRVLRKLLDSGCAPIIISVNQSNLHRYNPDYLLRLKRTVDRFNVPPNYIELEIAESGLTEDVEYMAKTIGEIHNMGFLVSIAGFGSGFVPLRFLRTATVDIIKMDRSWLNGQETSERHFGMFKSLVQLSHNLGIQVVCEGIETEAQLQRAQAVGCDIVQGYNYASPMTDVELQRFLKML